MISYIIILSYKTQLLCSYGLTSIVNMRGRKRSCFREISLYIHIVQLNSINLSGINANFNDTYEVIAWATLITRESQEKGGMQRGVTIVAAARRAQSRGMQRGCLVVTAHILYGNLAVSGKNVKLTSRGGRRGSPNGNKRENGTLDTSGGRW